MEKEIMVKVCSECGIVNTERAEECESCGEKLGEPVANSEVKKLIKQITKRNKKVTKAIEAEKYGGGNGKIPHIPITPARIVIGSIACLVAVGLAVLMVLCSIYPSNETNELIKVDLGGLLIVVIAILYCFLPSEMWAFSHLTYQLHYKEMPEPSDAGLVLQLIGCVFLILFGAAIFVLHLLVICGVL